jgi:transposase
VTKRSGRRCIVIMRHACQMRLRTAVYHWARTAIQHDELSRRRYASLRQRGHSHGRALRGVADRLLAVACAMLTRQAPFDPEHAGNRAAA